MDRHKLIYLITGLLLGGFLMYLFSNYTIARKNEPQRSAAEQINQTDSTATDEHQSSAVSTDIAALTQDTRVISYVKNEYKLPEYYITKSEARKAGWEPSQGNLCDVLPGRAIGGDRFSNREKSLPSGEQYYEADVNYQCGRRGADRIVYTAKGEVWLTRDHYRSFEKQ